MRYKKDFIFEQINKQYKCLYNVYRIDGQLIKRKYKKDFENYDVPDIHKKSA